jgi:hypothetical protein
MFACGGVISHALTVIAAGGLGHPHPVLAGIQPGPEARADRLLLSRSRRGAGAVERGGLEILSCPCCLVAFCARMFGFSTAQR